MATITEDYVSFETAKLLRDKGFDEICYLGYNKNGEYVPTSNRTNSQIIQPDFCFICCPTLQMAMKWLREVYNIHVVPKFDFYAGDYTGRIYDGRRESTVEKDDYIAIVGNSTYEQACEEAIKYSLEHLI